MKNLLYKEFKLAAHPTTYLFMMFGAMLLIPSYPYYVAFLYSCLSVYFVFLMGRENNDMYFTVLLPVKKRDAVKARVLMVSTVQILTVIIAIPFAVLGRQINPNPTGNPAGIEANAAFFGIVLIILGVFDALYFTSFYKSGYKCGKAMIPAGAAMVIMMVMAEALVLAVPAVNAALDNYHADKLPLRLCVLLAGIVIYFVLLIAAYRRSAANFEEVGM